jgi:hypothetical protein
MGLTSADIRRVIWTFVQAFLASFLVLAVGVVNAPNLNEAKAALISAVLAALAAGISAVKNAFLEDTSTIK